MRRRRPAQFEASNSRSLRFFQRNPGRISNFQHAPVRIWSQEHRAYWRTSAAGAGSGYTVDKAGAAVLRLPEAFRLTSHCGPEKEIWFEFVRRERRPRDADAGARKRCQAEIDIRAERDIEIADFLDGFAKLVRERRLDPCASPTATALEGLASSIRAGLVDEGMPA